jgi:hypothetical protein
MTEYETSHAPFLQMLPTKLEVGTHSQKSRHRHRRRHRQAYEALNVTKGKTGEKK